MEENRQDYTDAGLTFHDIFRFLKKSVPMLAVCVVICLVVGALVGVGISLTNEANGNIRGTIELTYDGISEGLDPIGNTFNSDSIRGVQVVLSALTNTGLNKYDVAAVRNAIKVEGVKPTEEKNETEETETFMPSKFTITLDYKKIDGMTESEAVAIVNNVMSTYLYAFENKYIVTDKMLENFLTEEEIKSNDFVETFNTISNEFEIGLDYIKSISNEQFVSSKGDTASSMKIEINSYMSKLNLIIANAKSGCVVRDKDATLNYLNYEITQIDEQITAKTATLNSIKDFLEAYSKQYPSVSVGGSSVANITVPKSDVFDNEFKKQTVIANEIENLTTQKASYQSWVTDLGSGPIATEEQILAVERSIIDFMSEANGFIVKYNQFTQEYSGNELASDIKIVSSAIAISTFATTPWLKIMLIALGIGVLLGLLLTPAGVKIKKNIAAQKAGKALNNQKEETANDKKENSDLKSSESEASGEKKE